MPARSEEQVLMQVGIDLDKRRFHRFGAGAAGCKGLGKPRTRARLPAFIAQLPSGTRALAAGGRG